MKRCERFSFFVFVVTSVSFKCQNRGQRVSGQRCQMSPDSAEARLSAQRIKKSCIDAGWTCNRLQ